MNYGSIESHGEGSSKHTAVGPIDTGPTPYERILKAYERQREATKPAAKPAPKATKPKPSKSEAEREAERSLEAIRKALYLK